MGKKNLHLLFFIWALAAISETSADLKIEANNVDFGEVTASDVLKFTVTLSQVDGAKLDATNLKLRVALPWFITFSEVTSATGGISTADKHHGNVEFTLPDMAASDEPIVLTINMNRNTSINLNSGYHSIVTPMTLRFQTVMDDGTSGPNEKKELTHSMPFIVPGCASALGMTSGNIKFYQVEASSALSELRPDKARLGRDAWCAGVENTDQWIQITLRYESRVSAIETYGRKEKESWVTKYAVQYSSDGVKWVDYTENGFAKTFEGNVGANSIEERDTGKKHWLLNPFSANYVRFRPLAWEIALCMRLEMYGCPIRHQENCITPLGMADGRIPDGSLSDNVQDQMSEPTNIRLNKMVTNYPFGWMASTGSTIDEWLQIDLGSMHKIDKVAIQGSWDSTQSMFFVTTFKMQYSNNSVTWNYAQENGQPKTFTGPDDPYEALAPTLLRIPEVVEARYLRILPENYKGMRVMRMELYGCLAEDEFKNQAESPVEFSRRTALYIQDSNELFACVYNDDREKSSCMLTTDGKKWKMLGTNIISIIARGAKSGNIYALDRGLSVLKSEDKGQTWMTLSTEEWERMTRLDGMKMAKNIPDIYPGSEPSSDLTFVDNNKNEWGISGEGIHTKAKGAGSWVTAAKWKCCGQ